MRDDVPAVADIDLSAVRHNVGRLRQMAGVEVMAVVKADAYGHGAIAVSRAAREAGATWLGVAFCSEALELRHAGDDGRMLAWIVGTADPALGECIRGEVDVSASSVEHLRTISEAAVGVGVRARVHLKVDTGLGRAGAPPTAWPALVSAALDDPAVDVVGLWSHLACADDPTAASTAAQVTAFSAAVSIAEESGATNCIRHLANSGAALSTPSSRFDLVRCGIGIYGLAPGPAHGSPAALDLRPAMTVRTSVVQVKRVPAGHGASYGLTWRAPRETSLALVPLGYADGLPRASRSALVDIGGERFPIVGRIAMDQVIVDIGDADIAPGAPVVVFGPGTLGEPTADDWAMWADTINYEIVTRIGPRVRRRYHDTGAPER
jgi:alanine racemase